MRRVFPSPALLILATLFAAACARSPKRELAGARADLAAASGAQANLYAPVSFEEARRALADAERMVRKFRFEDARLLALECSSHARKATALAAENRDRIMNAVGLKLSGTEEKISLAEREIAEAARRGVDEKEILLFEADAAQARSRLSAARETLAQVRIPEARKTTDDAESAADLLVREVDYALAENPVHRPRSRK